LNPDLVKDSILGALSGYLFFFLIEKLFKYLKGIEGLGRGDAKVYASMGALMGWQYLPYILLAASLLGLISVLIFFAVEKKPFRELKGYSIPFVPALSFGLLINLF
jgi:leader peptidase (prepilin peptidase)/N-methyltransferase